MKPGHLIILLFSNFCWGATYSAYKSLAPDLPASGAIVTLRFGLAGLFLLIAWPWLPGAAPRGRDLVKTCGLGLLLIVLGQRLQVYGNQIGTAGNSSILIALEPVVTSLAAAIFLHEHVGPRRLVGFCLGLVGVALLNGVGSKSFQWVGLGASLIFVSSFVTEAAYSVAGKAIVMRAGVMKMLAVSIWAGTGANLLIDGKYTFALAGAMPASAWALVIGLALINTVLGYTVWFVIIRECPVNLAALTIFAQSVFGVIIARFWLGEQLKLEQLAGSLTIVAGLVIGFSRQVHRAPAVNESNA